MVPTDDTSQTDDIEALIAKYDAGSPDTVDEDEKAYEQFSHFAGSNDGREAYAVFLEFPRLVDFLPPGSLFARVSPLDKEVGSEEVANFLIVYQHAVASAIVSHNELLSRYQVLRDHPEKIFPPEQ